MHCYNRRYGEICDLQSNTIHSDFSLFCQHKQKLYDRRKGMGALAGKWNGYSKFMTVTVLLFHTLNIYIVLPIKQTESVTWSQSLCQKAEEYKVNLSGC